MNTKAAFFYCLADKGDISWNQVLGSAKARNMSAGRTSSTFSRSQKSHCHSQACRAVYHTIEAFITITIYPYQAENAVCLEGKLIQWIVS